MQNFLNCAMCNLNGAGTFYNLNKKHGDSSDLNFEKYHRLKL